VRRHRRWRGGSRRDPQRNGSRAWRVGPSHCATARNGPTGPAGVAPRPAIPVTAIAGRRRRSPRALGRRGQPPRSRRRPARTVLSARSISALAQLS
jgi:hypothetical protein